MMIINDLYHKILFNLITNDELIKCIDEIRKDMTKLSDELDVAIRARDYTEVENISSKLYDYWSLYK